MQDKLSCRLALNHKTAGENTLAFKFRYTNVRKSFADFCGKVRIGGEEILSPLPSDINRYIPKFDLKISQIYNMGTVGTHLSNWILSKEYENKDQIYVANPANFNSLKLKFDFDIGDATLRGFETPSIKNIMLITSEGSIE